MGYVPPSDPRVPVKCSYCGQVYDLCAGVPVEGGRYLDCTVYTTPCCNKIVDDRSGPFWTARDAFERLTPEQYQRELRGDERRIMVRSDGTIMYYNDDYYEREEP